MRFREPNVSDVTDSCQTRQSNEPRQGCVHFQEPELASADSAVPNHRDEPQIADATRGDVGGQSEAADDGGG